ncbi:aa3-type cytochrome oxidase subunit II [Halostreptopolyspora alba]
MIPTRHRNRRSALRRWAPRGAALAVLGLAATGCASNEFTRLGIPEPITEQGERVLALWQGSWVAAFAVGILVWGLIIWSVIFHRKRSEQLPPQVRYNMPIEALYTVLPIVIIAVLFYFTARDQTYLMETEEPADLNVEVVAFQWSWQFNYLDDKRENGGETQYSVAGTPGEEGAPTLVIPEGQVVHFDLTSPDVIHSFWIPAFGFKLDVIPGQDNQFQVEVNEGTVGEYEGRCAELCGVDHSQMLFNVEVMEQDDYEEWAAQQEERAPENPEEGAVPAQEAATDENDAGTAEAEDTEADQQARDENDEAAETAEGAGDEEAR